MLYIKRNEQDIHKADKIPLKHIREFDLICSYHLIATYYIMINFTVLGNPLFSAGEEIGSLCYGTPFMEYQKVVVFDSGIAIDFV